MVGNISQVPAAFGTFAPRNTYTRPPAEQRMQRYEDIEIWVQPDRGNAVAMGNYLTVKGRKGYVAETNVPTIKLGTGMAGALPTLNFPGGNVSGRYPLHVSDYEVTGSYFVAVVFRIDAAAAMGATVYRLFSAGVDGGSDIEVYIQNGILYHRHGANHNSSNTGQFTAGASYLVWASYDAEANQAAMGINTLNPIAPFVSALSGPAGAGRPVVIGAKFNSAGTGSEQLLHGAIRAAFIARTAWVAPSKAEIRRRFLSEIGSLYPNDFTLT
ncbi:hypothetical protein MASR2M74_03190 [Paracoccaceae bacterium]